MDFKDYEIHKAEILGPITQLMSLLQYIERETQEFTDFNRPKEKNTEIIEKSKSHFLKYFKNDELQNHVKGKIFVAVSGIEKPVLVDKLMTEVIQYLESRMKYSELFMDGYYNGHSFQKNSRYWSSYKKENEKRHILFYDLMAKIWKEASQYVSRQKLESFSKYQLDGSGFPIRVLETTKPISNQDEIFIEELFIEDKYEEAFDKLTKARIIEEYEDRYRIVNRGKLSEKIMSVAIFSVLIHFQYLKSKPENIHLIIKACFGVNITPKQVSTETNIFLDDMIPMKGTKAYRYLTPIINALS